MNGTSTERESNLHSVSHTSHRQTHAVQRRGRLRIMLPNTPPIGFPDNKLSSSTTTPMGIMSKAYIAKPSFLKRRTILPISCAKELHRPSDIAAACCGLRMFSSHFRGAQLQPLHSMRGSISITAAPAGRGGNECWLPMCDAREDQCSPRRAHSRRANKRRPGGHARVSRQIAGTADETRTMQFARSPIHRHNRVDRHKVSVSSVARIRGTGDPL